MMERLTRKNRFLNRTVLVVCCCCLVVGSGIQMAFAQDESQDLQGIIPDYIPPGLSEGDFDQLGGNWAEWADETGRLVTDFYASDDEAVRGRRVTLERIQKKLDTMRRALEDSRYLSLYGPLADLHGRLARRTAIGGALLDTLGQDVTAPSPSRVNDAIARLGDAERSLRSELHSYNGGDRWTGYLQLDEIARAAVGHDGSPQALELYNAVLAKLQDKSAFDEQQRAFLDREPIERFTGALDRVVGLLDVKDPQQRQAELRDLAANLMEAVEQYEEEPTTQTMQQLRSAYDALRRMAPDGAATVTAAMRKHYLNYNFRVVVDESLARDVVRETQVDSGFINEMVSNAHVTGCQWTNATVNLDLKPSGSGVRFDLLLDGNVRSSATGSTHLATVYTSGQFHFHGRKQVQFDGEHFATWPAALSVGGGNRAYDARTKLGWVPIIRRIARNAALREAGSPENNQYARNKVYTQARSQFDRESTDMLHEAEQKLRREVTEPLQSEGYYPEVKRLSSTETEGELRSRLMAAGEVGGGEQLPLPIYPAHGALVQLHQSLLNQVGDRLDLEGKRFTPEQLDEYLKGKVEKIAGKPVDLGRLSVVEKEGTDSPKVEEIIFHDDDAVRFRVSGGEVVLYLSMGLKLEGREEIEPQRISVPLQFTLVGDKIQMERGTVGVSPIGPVPPSERTQQIARAGIMRQKIQEAFEPQEFDATFDFNIQNKSIRMLLTDLRARSGWLSLIATDGVSQSLSQQTSIVGGTGS